MPPGGGSALLLTATLAVACVDLTTPERLKASPGDASGPPSTADAAADIATPSPDVAAPDRSSPPDDAAATDVPVAPDRPVTEAAAPDTARPPDAASAAAPDAAGPGRRMSITIGRANVGTAGVTSPTLPGFVLLFATTHADLRSTGNGGSVATPDGLDFTFRALDAAICNGTAPCTLAHEIEKYDPTTGELVAWVKIPNLATRAAVADTVLTLEYGVPRSGPPAPVTQVWSGYRAVWHLAQPSGPARDSAGVNEGVVVGSATPRQAGKIAQALRFDGTGAYVSAPHIALDGRSFTISAWVYAENEARPYPDRVLLSQCAPGADQAGKCLQLSYERSPSELVLFSFFVDNLLGPSQGAPRGAWAHLAFTYTFTAAGQPGARRTFVNGVLVANDTTTPFAGTGGNTILGSFKGENFYWNGLLDEVRVTDTALGADLIQTEYANQSSPASFYTVSAPARF